SSSSSSLSASSTDPISESREPTPEWDPTAAYEALAPLHWDAEEFDFGVVSEEDEPMTEGEDLRLLFQEEPESGDGDGWSDFGSEGGSSAFSSDDDDDDGSDDDGSGDAQARSPKRRRY